MQTALPDHHPFSSESRSPARSMIKEIQYMTHHESLVSFEHQ
jgi:hypothetical protein